MTIATEELEALLEKATKGPWQVSGRRHSGDLKLGPNTRLHFVGPDEDGVAGVFFDMETGLGFIDAKLISLSPTLAAEVIRLREAAAALIARLDETLPAQDRRPTIAELEAILAAGNGGAVEVKPDGSIYVAPREEIEALRSALTAGSHDNTKGPGQ